MSDPVDVTALDSGNQLDAVMALPDHLRDALWRVDSAGLEEWQSSGLLVCGVGGSAIGGDLAAAALGDRLTLPLTTVRGYGMPSWTPPDRTALCCSYSGDTEETLACYEAAEALGGRRVVVTTNGELAASARRDGVPVIGLPAGLQPRAAVGYMLVVAAEVAALCGAAVGIRTEIDSTSVHLEAQREALAARAAELAAQLDGAIPVIYGGGLTGPVAYRWKCEINENAKLPAFWGTLPELDHNEIVGWSGAGEPSDTRFAAVFIEDRAQHPRERRRFEVTANLVEPNAEAVVRLETEGESPTERLLWAVMLGDLVSLQLAARRGVDPTPIEPIDRLKDELGPR
jgi:glucose/mannose-6-phosphate isomerase